MEMTAFAKISFLNPVFPAPQFSGSGGIPGSIEISGGTAHFIFFRIVKSPLNCTVFS
jgi:hypothetical protein